VPLPIEPLLPEIAEHLRREPNLVLEAPPGAGKTTGVPPALLSIATGDVLVLEPRRIAARMAARFVAAARGEPVGETVGYQVRFEEVAGPRTRLRFLTEGVLTRRLLSDRILRGVCCVVLDEFHERHLEGDLALALLRHLQHTVRPDLRLVVMSATLEAAPVAAFLGGARVIRSEGRQYPLEIQYTPHSPAPLEAQVAQAVERLMSDQVGQAVSPVRGHTLVFLPGAAEIRRAQSACSALARRRGWSLLPLHGDQSPEEQDHAVAPSAETKIILATNVAESSITIEGVTNVIDSGLARIAGHSPWSGLPTLEVARISQASANQRAGRAGRTAPGSVVRLYPLDDFVRRPAQQTPEIARADLAPTALLLHAMDTAFDRLDWLDAPPAAAVEQAHALLEQLGAFGPLGKEMARYPLHPRLSRLILEANRRGVAQDGCTVAALLSAGERLAGEARHATRSDLIALLESRWEPRTDQLVRQVRQMVRPPHQRTRDEDALLISVLAAFPDRVARRRQGSELLLAQGGSAELASASTVAAAPFVVAVEAEDRRDRALPLVRLASAIEPDWLLDLFPERVHEVSRLDWNRAASRVEQVDALMFGAIAIEETRGAPDPEPAAAMLAAKAIEAGFGRFADAEQMAGWEHRLAFAAAHGSLRDLPTIEDALRELASGLKSFAELEAAARDGGLLRALERRMTPAARRLLEEIAPDRIRLPGGRQVRVHYDPGQPPWIASRLQDFFGMRQTPAVAGGAVPVVVRLLAPNQRPVQTTTDLAGFWQRLYPQIRKELSRRYPKHKWPEEV